MDYTCKKCGKKLVWIRSNDFDDDFFTCLTRDAVTGDACRGVILGVVAHTEQVEQDNQKQEAAT